MSRAHLFDREPVAAIGGLAGLTGPAWGEPVAGVVDVVVFGAKSDGKTQFITHAIRTFEAVAPPGLSPEERLQNEKILSLVVNAKRPTPEANPDRKVRHYVFRVKPEKIYRGMGFVGRLGALWRGAGLPLFTLLAILSAGVVLGTLFLLRGGIDEATVGGACASGALGLVLAVHAARRAFLTQNEIEVVFWDVAGEDVYSDRGAGGYHSFLDLLVRARRVQDSASGARRRYALAPILICNPLSVGTRAEDSPYARLRMIMPTFAALHRPQPDVLVVVNRWRLVREICAGGDADDDVAVLPIARDAEVGNGVADAPRDPLPVLRRSVILKHCRDGEPVEVGSTKFETVSYEAGLDPRVEESEWKGWENLPAEVRARWGIPDGEPKALYSYSYAEGPGVLGGDTARTFYDWIARLIWTAGAPHPASAGELAAERPLAPPERAGSTVKMYAVDERAAQAAARTGEVENPGGFRSGGR